MDAEATYFDAYAQPIRTKDSGGFLGCTACDPATGAVVQTIADVDTTQIGDLTGMPVWQICPPRPSTPT